ncbi:MAG TPA: hypothetical protein VG389_14595 [Myxococcota bacterium]|jgi:hypothetical protein|nr:hypothetical protein [Myxococcota bacterium]
MEPTGARGAVRAAGLALALAAGAALALGSGAGCRCTGGGVGDACETSDDCRGNLVCGPNGACVEPGGGSTDSGGGGTSADSGGGGTSSDSGGGGTSADSGGAGGTCGGLTGMICAAAAWCDFVENNCGVADATGSCIPRPTGCAATYAPVCGCDGMVYSNDCTAQAAGQDVSIAGGCPAPAYYFACGPRFCQTGLEYCQRAQSDTPPLPDAYSCMPLPPACATGGAPTCACLAAETCGAMCTEANPGELTLTCAGG